MEEEDQRSYKNVIETFEFLVHSVLAFGIYHINNLKLKEIRVMICYHFGSEKLKAIPNKVELLEAVTEFLQKDW